MKEYQYFLHLENATKVWFNIIKNDVGVKVFVSSYMPKEFQKLNTETEVKYCGRTPEADRELLQKLYINYDVFYLNISEIFDCVKFNLSNKPNIVIAFVCIPKKEQGYKEKPLKYKEFIRGVLEDYYNEVNTWYIYVANKKLQKKYVEKHIFVVLNNKFSQQDKEFFEKCKTKYGIPQSEISLAKNIIKSYKNSKKHTYSITPELIKKLQTTKNTKDQ